MQGGDLGVQGDGRLVDRHGLGMMAELGQHDGVVLQGARVVGLQPRRLGVAGERQVVAAQRLVRGGEVGVGVGVAGMERDGAAVGGLRLRQAELAQAGVAKVEPAVGPVRRQVQRGLQRRLRLLGLAQFGQGDAQVGVRLGVLRVELHRRPESLGRLRATAQRPQRHAEVGLGGRELRVERGCGVARLQRLGGAAELVQGIGEV